MAKKKSSRKENPLPIQQINLPRELLNSMLRKSGTTNRHLYDQISPPPPPTKSWLKESASSKKPCFYNKQPKYPQLTQIITDDSKIKYHFDYLTCRALKRKQWSLTFESNKHILTVWTRDTNNVAYYYRKPGEGVLKHEITMVDKYDSENRVMEFTNVVEFDRKLYALSFQGTLVVMEEMEKAVLTITGVCKTRVVPSCGISAKFFDEYLIESRGNVFLVFLICREMMSVVNEVEVYRISFVDGLLELVKVGGLGGRTFFLEKKYYMWVDSREIGCKGDCVYFFTDDGWRMYDLETKSISVDEPGMYNTIRDEIETTKKRSVRT